MRTWISVSVVWIALALIAISFYRPCPPHAYPGWNSNDCELGIVWDDEWTYGNWTYGKWIYRAGLVFVPPALLLAFAVAFVWIRRGFLERD
jgi:hypothetical protein